MNITLREKLALVSLVYHFAIILIAGGIAILGYFLPNQLVFDSGILLLILHGLSFRRLAIERYIQQYLLRSHKCDCGFVIPLTDVSWRCQCSFISGPRSCLSPCARCGRAFDTIVCPNPRCGTGHLLVVQGEQAQPERRHRRER